MIVHTAFQKPQIDFGSCTESLKGFDLNPRGFCLIRRPYFFYTRNDYVSTSFVELKGILKNQTDFE